MRSTYVAQGVRIDRLKPRYTLTVSLEPRLYSSDEEASCARKKNGKSVMAGHRTWTIAASVSSLEDSIPTSIAGRWWTVVRQHRRRTMRRRRLFTKCNRPAVGQHPTAVPLLVSGRLVIQVAVYLASTVRPAGLITNNTSSFGCVVLFGSAGRALSYRTVWVVGILFLRPHVRADHKIPGNPFEPCPRKNE